MIRTLQSAPCPGQTASIFSQPDVVFDYILHGCPTAIGTPPAPPVSQWTLPPANEGDAQATVDAAVNEQLRRQQELNAAGVSPVVDIGGLDSFDTYKYWILGGALLIGGAVVMGGRR